MNLMGRRGRFVLKSPFDNLAPQGAQGRVIEVVKIRHAVTSGIDVLNRGYVRVGAQELYQTHLTSDVTIITIELDEGGKVTVPDTHIEHLNDISLHYVTGYLTVKVGVLPANYDYSIVQKTMADEVTKISGVKVQPRDVSVSVSERNGFFFTPEQAEVEESRRMAAVEHNSTDYARLLAEIAKNEELLQQILSLEQSVINLSKPE